MAKKLFFQQTGMKGIHLLRAMLYIALRPHRFDLSMGDSFFLSTYLDTEIRSNTWSCSVCADKNWKPNATLESLANDFQNGLGIEKYDAACKTDAAIIFRRKYDAIICPKCDNSL